MYICILDHDVSALSGFGNRNPNVTENAAFTGCLSLTAGDPWQHSV